MVHENRSDTDPSGFFLKGLFKAIGNFLRAILMAQTTRVPRAGRLRIRPCLRARGPRDRAIDNRPGDPADRGVRDARGQRVRVCCRGGGLTLAAGGTLKQAFIGAAYAGIHQAIGGIANSTVAAAVKVGLHAVVGGAFCFGASDAHPHPRCVRHRWRHRVRPLRWQVRQRRYYQAPKRSCIMWRVAKIREFVSEAMVGLRWKIFRVGRTGAFLRRLRW